jgi:hypothetical protein
MIILDLLGFSYKIVVVSRLDFIPRRRFAVTKPDNVQKRRLQISDFPFD